MDWTERISGLGAEERRHWLARWNASQGGLTRDRRLARLVSALPLDACTAPRVLDVCCGPGDLGRAVVQRFPDVRLDGVDREPLLLALCAALHRDEGVAHTLFRRDLWDEHWSDGLATDYDAVVASTALHWFDPARLGALLRELRSMLRDGGVLAISEPIARPDWLAPESASADEYDVEGTWDAFWNGAADAFGYERDDLDATPADAGRPIGDDGLPALAYVGLLRDAGFREVDVVEAWNGDAVFAAVR